MLPASENSSNGFCGLVIPTGSNGDGIIYLHEWLIFMVKVGKYTSSMDPIGSKAGVLKCPNCRAGCTKGGYLKCPNFMIWFFSQVFFWIPQIILLVVPGTLKQPVFSGMFVYFQPFPKCWDKTHPVEVGSEYPIIYDKFLNIQMVDVWKPWTIGSLKLAKNCWKNVLKPSRPGFLGVIFRGIMGKKTTPSFTNGLSLRSTLLLSHPHPLPLLQTQQPSLTFPLHRPAAFVFQSLISLLNQDLVKPFGLAAHCRANMCFLSCLDISILCGAHQRCPCHFWLVYAFPQGQWWLIIFLFYPSGPSI